MLATSAGASAARADGEPPPQPYALPFQLRPAIAPNAMRLEATWDAHDGGTTGVLGATFAKRVVPDVAVIARAVYAFDAPNGASVEPAFANPVLGALYTPVLIPGMRVAIFGGLALPLGQGDGLPSSDPEVVALGRGRVARASMDNAVFATSYFTIAIGLGWVYTVERFTFQLEATLLAGTLARGSTADPVVENLTSGAWVAYTPIDALSFGFALQHQHFVTTPALVRADDINRSQTSIAVAVRGRISGAGLFWNPGFSYTHGLDGFMVENADNVFTFDLIVQY